MLARVFSTLANSGNAATIQWLQSVVDKDGSTVTRVNMFQDYVVLETDQREELAWTNGMLYKKLKESRPAKAIPFLVELCRLYDSTTGTEVDRFLTDYLATRLSTPLELSPFYVIDGKLTTILSTKAARKTTIKGCKVVDKNKKEITVSLNSSKSLRSALLAIIRRKAL